LKPSKHHTYRTIREIFGRIYTALLLFLDFSRGMLNLKPKLVLKLNKSDLLEKSYGRVAIFAGYINTESEALEAERILKLLRIEFDLLILVNTGKRDLDLIQTNLVVLQRDNFGRDLASYKYALDYLLLEKVTELFFFNDSVFWTGNSVFNFLESARRKNCEVTALTSSDQHSFHLQSYALHLKGDIAELSKAFKTIRISNFKRVIVEAGEKRLSRYWLAKHNKIGGVHNQDSLIPLLANYKDVYLHDYERILNLVSQRVPLNPSIHFWAPLYAQSGVIKKALLTKNPARLKNAPKSLTDIQSKVTQDKKLR
jgi:hypothetical protein